MLLVGLNGTNEVPIQVVVTGIRANFTYLFPTLSLAEEVHSATFVH